GAGVRNVNPNSLGLENCESLAACAVTRYVVDGASPLTGHCTVRGWTASASVLGLSSWCGVSCSPFAQSEMRQEENHHVPAFSLKRIVACSLAAFVRTSVARALSIDGRAPNTCAWAGVPAQPKVAATSAAVTNAFRGICRSFPELRPRAVGGGPFPPPEYQMTSGRLRPAGRRHPVR